MSESLYTGVWDAQDHARSILEAAKADTDNALHQVAFDFGHPTRVEDEHVWLSEEVTDWDRAPTSTTHDDELFHLRIHAYVQQTTSEFLDVRDRLREILDAVVATIGPAAWVGAVASVYSVRVRRGQIEGAIVSESPITRAAMATVWLEVRAMIDHPLGG